VHGPVDDDVIVSDDDLAAEALAADPEQPIPADAVPLSFDGEPVPGLLPDWYMPAATRAVHGRLRRSVVGVFVLALVVITAAGLCVTYGLPEIAW
jgi:hypothetical protein